MADRSLPNAPKKKGKTAAKANRREKATQELVDTEVTYNTLLGLLIKHYVQPLGDYKLISTDQHNALFPQLQIIKGLSDKFLEDLKQRRESWDPKTSKLSDLFETFTPYFRMYQGYVNNHEKSVALMRKLNEKEKWGEYCTNVRPLCKRFDLSSLLILPIQRLPRYKLLLSEIHKNTQDSHPDCSDLQKALEKVQNISLEINSRMKEFERRETVKKIERKFEGNIKILEPHRQFIREGKLWKVCRNKDRLYQFFLFNDIFLYGSSFGRGYKFHNMLPINAAFSVSLIEDAGQYGTEKNGRIWQIVSEIKSFVVFCDTTNEAQSWLTDIKTCIDEQSKKAHSGHYKTDSHSAGVWVPDSHAKNCKVCNDKFSFVNRRHHCRRCGVLVCGKCSKYKLPNAESVMQRSCKTCYFQLNIAESNGANGGDHDSKTDNTDMDDDVDDFEDENAALHQIQYYVDNTDETFTTEDIFNKFGHGVGSYVLVPADQSLSVTNYYTVTLVVYTQTGFESFNVSLFEKKGTMMYRLESKKLKKKDFNDMSGLIAYIERKQKLIFSYAIPRNEVEQKLNNSYNYGFDHINHMMDSHNTATIEIEQHQSEMNNECSIKGLDNYPKARALFDYSAEVHGDLTLRAGDIIYILDREETDGWWTGMVANRQGLFPSTYVEIIEEKPLPSIHKNEPNEGDILIARYDYEEGGTEELAFNIGDKIILQAKDESGWWLGKLDKTGVVGWFAPDLVVPLNESEANANANEGGTPQTKPKPKGTKGKSKASKGKSKTKPQTQTKPKPKPKKSSHSKDKTANKNGASDSVGKNEPSVVISYKKLKAKQFVANVDKTQLEHYLSNKEFYEVFKMSRSEFAKKPGWKRRNLKKDKGLF